MSAAGRGNFYAVLGVSEWADDQEIQDRIEAFKQASAVLGDPKKRGEYDRQRSKKRESVIIFSNDLFLSMFKTRINIFLGTKT